ncbi:MAG: alginate export family protein [Planctomycetota bacterium]
MAGASSGQTDGHQLPPIEITRWSEDYSVLADPPGPDGILQRMKWIELDDERGVVLTTGGSIREQFEGYRNRAFGFEDGDDDFYLLHRTTIHADLRLGDHARVFGEVASALIAGRDVEPSPVDENEFFLHQGFLDLRARGGPAVLRLGRQEFSLGSGRLFSLRDGPNVRLAFDGARLTLASRDTVTDLFVLQPVDIRLGVFDDRISDDTVTWGVHTAIDVGAVGGVDVYYIGIAREGRSFGNAAGNETRHSFGSRWYIDRGGFDANLEGVVQIGSLGDADIFAWTIASDTGHSWDEVAWSPRLGLRANISSGDRYGAGRTGTFDPLFPNNSYFSEAAVISPSNLIDLNPTLTLRPDAETEITAMWDFVWRTSVRDAVYGPPGVPLFDAALSDGRFVGHSVSLLARREMGRHVTANAAYTHFSSGDAVTEAGGDDVDYLAVWVEFKL